MGGSQSAKINWHHFRCVTFIYLEIFFAESKSVTQHSQHDGLLILRLRHFLAEPSMISKWRWTIVQLSRQLWMRAVLFALLAAATALATLFFKELIPPDLSGKIGAHAVDKILNILASGMLVVTTFSLSVMVAAYSSATSS